MIHFRIDGHVVNLSEEEASRLADLLYGVRGTNIAADSARLRIEHVLDGETAPEPLEWTAEEKNALVAALYLWIDQDTYAAVPEHIRTDLRYALYGDLQDDRGAGLYLLELEHEGAIIEAYRQRDRQPVKGEPLRHNGETYVVERVLDSRSSDFLAVVYAYWIPG